MWLILISVIARGVSGATLRLILVSIWASLLKLIPILIAMLVSALLPIPILIATLIAILIAISSPILRLRAISPYMTLLLTIIASNI